MGKKAKKGIECYICNSIQQILCPKIVVAGTCDGENQKRSKVEHGHILNVQIDCFVLFEFYIRLIVQERKKEDDKGEINLKEEMKEMRQLLELLLKKSAGVETVQEEN